MLHAFLAFVIILLIGIIVSWKEMRYVFRANFALSNKSLVLLPEEVFKETWFPFLNMYFPYFQHLNENGKERFRIRLIQNLRDLEIIGKDVELNDEMRILLCASLTQLTFGLKRQGLRGYKLIHVYPASFYAKQYNGYVDSVTYKSNLIALSWIHFEKGILNTDDGKNPGLSEFAYALVQTVKNGERFDLKFGSYLNHWNKLIKEDKHAETFYSFIGMAGTDETDMLPHAIPVFFERPMDFKLRFPSIYAHLCLLLNQNPVNITENYAFSSLSFNKQKTEPALPEKIVSQYHYHQWHWSYSLFIIAPFLLPFLSAYFIFADHIINYEELIGILLLIGAVTTLATFKLNRKHLLFGSIPKLASFNTIAISPLLFASALLINDSIPVYHYAPEEHEILGATSILEHEKKRGTYITDYEIYFGDDFLADYPFARRIDAVEVPRSDLRFSGVQFTINRGILGFRHIANKKVIYHSIDQNRF